MDMETLVKAIAEEVLKQAAGREEATPVLIIGERGCPKCEAAEKHLGEGHRFLYPDEAPGADAEIRRIVPYLSIRHMADLAAARADGPLMEVVFAALLAGRPVEVMEFEYRRHADTAPEGLLRLFEEQERTLATFGLAAMDLTSRDTVRIRKKLVAEADVAEAGRKKARELLLPPGARMTPLAEESAAKLGIAISRK